MNWNKLNPSWWIKNDDNPIPPDNLWSCKPQWIRKILWFLRNPFHNFTFYVIGMADKPELRICNEVFNNFGKWNIILPFISYNGKKVFWYFGWRERGNFGIKFCIRSK